ncbi:MULTISPECIES: hypothetical protein [unclassified Flavobacterium]|uniref:hypothetical protein n=1 Tax=unclassified Flavobacterium TaxID=196869 RepID=UPI00361CD245
MKTLFKITAVFLILTSCQITKIAAYDSYSHQKTVALKVRTYQLISKSQENYAIHQTEATALLLELQQQYAYEKSKPNNAITVAMWSRVIGSEKTLLSQLFALWHQKEKLHPDFSKEAAKQINETFDQIITLETQKIK